MVCYYEILSGYFNGFRLFSFLRHLFLSDSVGLWTVPYDLLMALADY